MGVPIAILVVAIDALTFGSEILERHNLLHTFGNVLLICIVLAGLLPLLVWRDTRPACTTQEDGARTFVPELLQRLPPDKRGELVSISACDHYVRVVTTRGHSMLLMRLRDAIGETNPLPGIQTHRSHWVALEAIQSLKCHRGRYQITTTANDTLAVSRTSLPRLRKAGLL